MPEWETHTKEEWLDRITDAWMTAGTAALRSRGQFNVALDASAESLLVCRHLATIDWPWSTTHLFPVRENWVPQDHARHSGNSIYKAFYPHKITVTHWKTNHVDYQRAADLYARSLKKDSGDLPKFDLCLLAFAGEQSLEDLEGTIPEFTLTSLYQVKSTRLPCLALTPWVLKASRKVIGLSKGLNPPVTDSFPETSPLHGLLEDARQPLLLHTP
jgi:hypothetical protein